MAVEIAGIGRVIDATRMVVMLTGRVVVAVRAASVVVGPLLEKLSSGGVAAVNVPSQAGLESLKTRQRGRNRLVVVGFRAVFVNFQDAQQHAVGIVVFVEDFHEIFERVGSHPVVAVQESDEFSPSVANQFVASLRLTAVFGHLKDFHASVTASIFLQNFPRIVRRTVVHTQNLDVLNRLSQQRVQTLLQIRRSVVNRHQNRYARRHFPRILLIFALILSHKWVFLRRIFTEIHRLMPNSPMPASQ